MNIQVKAKNSNNEKNNTDDDVNNDKSIDSNKNSKNVNNRNRKIGSINVNENIEKYIKKDIGINTNTNSIIKYQKIPFKITQKDNKCIYNFCMVSNLMIISITLLILVYYLYNLTDKIRSIDFNTISEGIGSVNQNLNNINLLGGKITPLIDQYQNSDISDLSVKKLIF